MLMLSGKLCNIIGEIMPDITEISATDPMRIIVEIDKQIRPDESFDPANNSAVVLKYFQSIKHAYETFGIKFPLGTPKEFTYSNAPLIYNEIRSEIEKLEINVLQKKILSETAVALDEPWRDRIHSYLAQIRKIVERSDVLPNMRERILTSLNALAAEVDRNRAPLNKFTDALVVLCEGISNGATALTPAVRVLERIIGAVSRVRTSDKPPLALPKPSDFGLDEEKGIPELPPPDQSEISN
jgi:hypothetical protein